MTDGPYSFSHSILVDAAPGAVYAVVSDVRRTGEWSPICVTCEWDDTDEPQLGAHFTGHNRARDREWNTTSEVTAAEPGRAFTWEVSGGLVRWGYRIEPDGRRSRLTETWEFLEKGRRAFRERYGDSAEREMDIRGAEARSGIPATLAAIKQIVETEQPPN